MVWEFGIYQMIPFVGIGSTLAGLEERRGTDTPGSTSIAS